MKDRLLVSKIMAVLLVLLLAGPLQLLAQNYSEPVLPNPGDVGISKQQQEQLGLKAMGEVYQQMPVLPDSDPVVRYVQQLGQRLAGVIPPDRSWPYQFHVIPEKEINAFAIPGGPVFINIGTINAAGNEAELAGVMAHEMSHVYMQHSVKQMKQNVGPSILAGLGQVLGQMIGGVGGAIASVGGQLGGGLLSMRYSRADEAQADAVGAIIMYKAGYNPVEMANFFKKLEQQGGRGGPQYLSDHPNPGNRYQAVSNEVKNWPPKSWLQTSPQFASAKSQAQKIQAYSAQQISAGAKSGQWATWNRQHGSVPKNVSMPATGASGEPGTGGNIENVSLGQVSPSGKYTNYQGEFFTIKYPDNWQASGGQQGPAVTIAPSAGVSQGSVAYGVIINGAQVQSSGSLDEAVQELVSGLQQDNPDLKMAGSPQPITVNGVQGRSVDLIGASPVQQNGKPQRERDWLVVLPYQGNNVLYLVFIAPEDAFGKLRPTYEHMLKSFHLQQG